MLKKLNKFLLALLIVPCLFVFTGCKKDKNPQSTVQTYTINYVLNGGENNLNNPISYKSDVQNLPILDATREAYDFAGWFSDENLTNQVTAIVSGDTGDKTFYAKWTPKTFTITYKLYGGTQNVENLTSYNIESSTFSLKAPSKNGYTFAGWFDDESLTNQVTEIKTGSTGDKTFYASWSVQTYTISYELNGGIQSSENVTSYNIESDDIVLKSPSKNGYTFDGWFDDESLTNQVAEIKTGSTGDKTFYAGWLVQTYTISYELNGGVQSSENVTTYNIESTDILLKNASKYGYVFDGWFEDSDLTNKVEKIETGSTGNKKFYAKWVAGTFKILFDYNGADLTTGISEKNVTFGEEIGELPTPTKTDYTFQGWVCDGSVFTSTTICDFEGSKTLVASWRENEKPAEKYTVTFDSNGGTPVESLTDVEFGTSINEPQDVTKTGYKLIGWYLSGEIWNFNTKSVISNITLTAEWEIINYKIDYVLDGGTNADGNPTTYNIESDEITLLNPTKVDYSFRGWFTDSEFANQITKILAGTTGDITLYANFKYIDPSAFCNVILDYNLPEILTGLYNNYETRVQQYTNFDLPSFENTTLRNYFLGFYYLDSNKNEIKIEGNVFTVTTTGELTIYAKWNESEINENYASDSLVFILDESNEYAIVANYSGFASTVVIPKYYTLNETNYPVLKIQDNCFSGNMTLKKVVINAIGIEIGKYTFANSSLEDISFENVKSVDSYAFEGTNIETLKVGSYFTTFGESAFRNAKKLTTVDLFNANETLQEISSYAFAGCEKLNNIRLNKNIQTVSSYAFADCTSLEGIDFLQKGSQYLALGSYVFANCSKILNIFLPENIYRIGQYVFNNCEINTFEFSSTFGVTSNFNVQFGLKSVLNIIIKGTEITKIENNYFGGLTTLYHVEMGSSVESVSSYAFYGCTNLTEIIFSDNIDPTTFTIDAYTDTAWYKNLSDMLVFKNALVFVPNTEKLTRLVINNDVTQIGLNAVKGNEFLTYVYIPNTVTIINNYAFSNCSNLEQVEFEDGSSVSTIGEYAFYNCKKLSEFNFEKLVNLTSIGDYAFQSVNANNDEPIEVVLVASLTEIGQGAFASVKVSNFDCKTSAFAYENGVLYGLNSNGEKINLLYYSYSNTDEIFVLPSTLETISAYAFSFKSNLKYVFAPTNKLTITKRAFYRNTDPTSIIVLSGTYKNKDNNNTYDYELNKLGSEKYTISETETGEYDIVLNDNLGESANYIEYNGKYLLVIVNSKNEIKTIYDITNYSDLL